MLISCLRTFLVLLAGFSVCGLVAGCDGNNLPAGVTRKAVALNNVPDAVRAAASKAVPQVDFKEAWQNLDSHGKLQSYEIRGRQSVGGKIREVRVSLTGKILEAELH